MSIKIKSQKILFDIKDADIVEAELTERLQNLADIYPGYSFTIIKTGNEIEVKSLILNESAN